MTTDHPAVLFLCVHNAGRSQMAAGLLRLAAGGSIIVSSAGSDPAEALNPAVVAAMEEIGVDITDRAPTKLTDDMIQAVDVVVTMGCGDACPVYAGKRYLDWEVEDPAGPAARSRPNDPRRHRRPGEPAHRRAARRTRLSRWVTPCPRDRFLASRPRSTVLEGPGALGVWSVLRHDHHDPETPVHR